VVGSAAGGARLGPSMRCRRLWPTPDSGHSLASMTFRLRRGGSIAHNGPIAWFADFLIFGGLMGVLFHRGPPALRSITPIPGGSGAALSGIDRKRVGAHGRAGKRPKPVISGTCVPSPPEHANPSSRTDAHRSVSVRTPTATGTATELLPELLPADPALREVCDAWDRLPEAVRAGIVAMVRATSGPIE
jgi:hypothetical protein